MLFNIIPLPLHIYLGNDRKGASLMWLCPRLH